MKAAQSSCVDELNESFAIENRLVFESDAAGMPRGRVCTPSCQGEFYLHGAHVTRFQPESCEEVLFVSREAVFSREKAIRGGVPICFPWFGASKSDPSAASHGLARTHAWDVMATSLVGDDVEVKLGAAIQDFEVQYLIRFGSELQTALRVTNTADSDREFEAALHSYFSVSDVQRISVTGLESTDYLDQLSGEMCPASHEAIRFTEETDRVYQGPENRIAIVDADARRTIVIEKSGSQSTVVWNPWSAKAARLNDFGNDEWPGMCCIETAAIAPNQIVLRPSATHTVAAIHRVETM